MPSEDYQPKKQKRYETCRILQKVKPPTKNISKDETKALEDIRQALQDIRATGPRPLQETGQRPTYEDGKANQGHY